MEVAEKYCYRGGHWPTAVTATVTSVDEDEVVLTAIPPYAHVRFRLPVAQFEAQWQPHAEAEAEMAKPRDGSRVIHTRKL